MKINNYLDCYLVLFILNLNYNFNLKKNENSCMH